MKYIDVLVYIRKNDTGEERVVSDKLPEGDGMFAYEDGNFRCDCNRGIMFEGEYSNNMPCGETRYSVCITLPGGEVLYSEYQPLTSSKIQV